MDWPWREREASAMPASFPNASDGTKSEAAHADNMLAAQTSLNPSRTQMRPPAIATDGPRPLPPTPSPLFRRESAPPTSAQPVSRRPSMSFSEAGDARQRTQSSSSQAAIVRLVERPLLSNKFATSPQFAVLKDLAGATAQPFPESAVWNKFLNGTVPSVYTIQDAYDLERAMDTHARSMFENYRMTNNFSTLVLLLLTHLRRMRNHAYEGDWPQEAQNAMFGVRVFTKYFVEHASKRQLIEIFENDKMPSPQKDEVSADDSPKKENEDATSPTESTARSNPSSRRSSVVYNGRAISIDAHVVADKRKRSLALLEELLHVIIFANTNTAVNYDFYVEAVNLLLVLLSGQMTRVAIDPSENDHFLLLVLDRLGHFAKGALGRLIVNFIQQPQRPMSTSGVFFSAYSYLFSAKEDQGKASVLADKSILLMLVLVNQGAHIYRNNFREALSAIVDSGGASTIETSILAEMPETNVLNLSFKEIYESIVRHIHRDETCLLLYAMLLKNREFRLYVLSRTDPENLTLPILRFIYESIDRRANYSLLYTLLTILLILSQDDVYNENSHKVIIQPPTWFTERIVRNFTLGGLTVLVLIRVVQANTSRHRDLYFHTTSLAILANMSSTISAMHPIVAQRLIGLYESVSKKYIKLSNKIAPNADLSEALQMMQIETEDLMNTDGKASIEIELTICSDILALILEIINSVVTHTLKNNPHMVYALLHRRDMFSQFKSYVRFAELIKNIETAISFFSGRLTDADLRTPTPEDILKVIEAASMRWSSSRLDPMPDVKFQYEEEAEYQRFFVPYVWSMVYQHGLIYWDVSKAQLLREIDPDFPEPDLSVPL